MKDLNIGFNDHAGLSPGRLACFLSHRLAWQKIHDSYNNSNEEIPIILEDDMDLLDFELFLEIEKELVELSCGNILIIFLLISNTLAII